MSNYAASAKAPRTLTEAEQKKLLTVTGERANSFRDHMIFSVALGTGLRSGEILALNFGDVFDSRNRARRRVYLRVFKKPRSKKAKPGDQSVILPDILRYKLEKYRRWMAANEHPTDNDSPLFLARLGKRLGDRGLRMMFARWQKECGFSKHFHFHALRHTALTNLYRKTRDIRLVQRQARHANINTTTIYAAPSDDDVARAVRDLDC